MRSQLHLVSSLVVLLSASSALADGPRMAVLPLRAEGLQLNDAQRLNVLVRQRAATRGGYTVEKEDTTSEVVDAGKGLGLDCGAGDIACIVRLGNLADVAFVIAGSAVGGMDGQVGIDLILVDVAARAEKRRVTALLPADIDAQMNAFNDLAVHLFSTAPLPTLAVTSKPAGADVVVDGVVRGVTPTAAPLAGLAPGTHIVVVRKKGFLPRQQTLSLSAGEAADLDVSLEVDPQALRAGPEETDRTLPFVLAGVSGAVAVGGLVTAGIGLIPVLSHSARTAAFNELAAGDVNARGYDDDIAEANAAVAEDAANWATWGIPSVITGTTLVVVGAAGLVGGLWWGFDAAERAESAQVRLDAE